MDTEVINVRKATNMTSFSAALARGRAPVRVPAAAVVLAVALVLGGCSDTTDAPPNVEVADLVGPSDTAQTGAVEPAAPSSGSVPQGWPEIVQLVPGPIVSGSTIGDGNHMVTIAVEGNMRATFEAGADLLVGAGFTEVFRFDEEDDNLSGSWTADGLSVQFNVSTTDGVPFADYVVSQKKVGDTATDAPDGGNDSAPAVTNLDDLFGEGGCMEASAILMGWGMALIGPLSEGTELLQADVDALFEASAQMPADVQPHIAVLHDAMAAAVGKPQAELIEIIGSTEVNAAMEALTAHSDAACDFE